MSSAVLHVETCLNCACERRMHICAAASLPFRMSIWFVRSGGECRKVSKLMIVNWVSSFHRNSSHFLSGKLMNQFEARELCFAKSTSSLSPWLESLLSMFVQNILASFVSWCWMGLFAAGSSHVPFVAIFRTFARCFFVLLLLVF